MKRHCIRGASAAAGRFAIALILALAGTLQLAAAGNREKTASPSSGEEPKELVVWTYDSFTSEWGPGPKIAEAFKAATGITLRFVTQGDGGALLSKLIAEGKNADADVLLGIDQNLLQRALDAKILVPYKPAGAEGIPAELVLDDQFRLTPYDYGYFAIVYDSEKVKNPPKSLEDLAKPEFQRKLILMDPRTSTPGLGFLAWTRAVYGDAWQDYWKRLSPSILTVSDGWDTGYGLFTSGEAPMVLSYTTSPAYHLEYDKTERYRAALFAEGHAAQIEGAGLLATARRPGNARRFLDFMLTPAFQTVIPLTNWMYPIVETPLPDSYRIAPKPAVTLKTEAPSDATLAEWARIVGSR